jgi:hypothetical protein
VHVRRLSKEEGVLQLSSAMGNSGPLKTTNGSRETLAGWDSRRNTDQ